jgi:hypothetical protein
MKKLFSVLLVAAIFLILTVPALAAEPSATAEQMAAELKAWGLFRGVSDQSFDLYRAPTRTEALVMLIRVQDAEEVALAGSWQHPFADVPDWADKYVGYAYEKGLTKGVSDVLFGANDKASAGMYLTFMLRALGYNDAAGDFSWEHPYDLAKQTGMLNEMVNTGSFWRRDAVIVSYYALDCVMKGGAETLGKTLGIDTSVHPVAARNSDQQLLADYFKLDLFYVTCLVDMINDQLAADGYAESYTLPDVKKLIDGGSLDACREGIESDEGAFNNFVYSETVRVYTELSAD